MERDESDISRDDDEPEDKGTVIDDRTEGEIEDVPDEKENIFDINMNEIKEVNKENKEVSDDNKKQFDVILEENTQHQEPEGPKSAVELDISNPDGANKEQETGEAPKVAETENENDAKVMSDYRSLSMPKRPRSMIKSELLVKDVKKFIEDMKKQTAPEDLDVRIIPSNMACRFELPIDLTRLKDECPLSYLKKYCRVTDSRVPVYKEKYSQCSLEQAITVSHLKNIYENLFQVSTLSDEVMHLQRLLELDLSMELDEKTFIVVSCLMERIMLKSQGRGPAQGYKKNIFEVTNFSALNGKLQGIEISHPMMNLLKYIRGT